LSATADRAAVTSGETGPVPGAHRFSHAAMATLFEIHCVHADATYAGQAARAAFDLVDRLEREMSRFVANSDISRINALSPGRETRVSPETMACLLIARRMYDITGGAFDISIGSGLPELDIVPDEFVVRARAEGVRLDLGGVGKGYAIDRVAELLEEWEIFRAVVHGGFSSVLALEGPSGEGGWPLTLSSPWAGGQEILAHVSARHRAFSASGTQKGDHIRDPLSGEAVRGRAAWAALPRAGEGQEDAAAVAEALSTAFMVLSPDRVAELARRWPGLEAWLLPEPAHEEISGPPVIHVAG
jgi:thiamine biosynthesis lipoprotein